VRDDAATGRHFLLTPSAAALMPSPRTFACRIVTVVRQISPPSPPEFASCADAAHGVIGLPNGVGSLPHTIFAPVRAGGRRAADLPYPVCWTAPRVNWFNGCVTTGACSPVPRHADLLLLTLPIPHALYSFFLVDFSPRYADDITPAV